MVHSIFSWVFLNLDLLVSHVNYSLFTYHRYNIQVFLLIYVDNILITGNDSGFINSIIHEMQAGIALKDLGSLHYFLGILVSRDAQGLN